MKSKSSALINKLIVITILCVVAFGCKDEDSINKPIISTIEVSAFAVSSAMGGGILTSDGGSPITARGICWSTEPNPTISQNTLSDANLSSESFNITITDLTPNTKYYIRAYATNSAGTAYGDTETFTTQSADKSFNSNLVYNSITDIDGNVYKTITIGTQTWMAENLKVTHYRNGDPIPYVSDTTEWKNLTTGAYCDYHNSPGNAALYGHLYTWLAIEDSRGICPEGWHIPSETEWEVLKNYIANNTEKLKEAGSTHWNIPNSSTSNETGFTAIPSGMRFYLGSYGLGLSHCILWSSTQFGNSDDLILGYRIASTESQLTNFPYKKKYGLAIRCIKD